MHYKTLAVIVAFLLIFLMIGLMAMPTAHVFMYASALLPILLGILVIGVLRSPAASDIRETQSESDWYDHS